ncbi:uncharacterized protein LOC129718173 [Wyeomyia smithii]|uniref:uncharacterized protein LOC129718173 n=1 Tax=Wyeomyia smithii TaxID=174621 RepID=UPI002467DE66|nr:uncharacterized protein LOC129718173 [Wyeomyia smithii]
MEHYAEENGFFRADPDVQDSAPPFYTPPDAGQPHILETLLSNQNKILENQRRMQQMMTSMMTSIDYLTQAVKVNRAAPSTQTPRIDFNDLESVCVIQPVNSVDDLNQIEESLKDDAYMRKHLAGMSFICGSNGKANGIDCCYRLIDSFITRSFLLNCSWTGNARDLDGASSAENARSDTKRKIPLKFYNRFRTLFFRLVKLADKDFTEVECEVFFKRVLKNSKQRVEAKMTTSKHKNRPSKLKYKRHKDGVHSSP